VELPTRKDPRGALTFLERDCPVPFDIARVFYIYGVPEGLERGAHSNRDSHLMFALSGSVDVSWDNGFEQGLIELDSPEVGLFIPEGIWRELKNFRDGTVLVTLSNEKYSEDLYIRDYEQFKAYVQSSVS
jgi:dTDP-4-dehydrorhamnose 3,5-epimerase-like enzyme